jgi:hypothetical protein
MADETRQSYQQEKAATIMRGPDGALYLIRDDVLQLCKMTPEDASSAEKVLQAHKKGTAVREAQGKSGGQFKVETARFEPLARVEGTFTPMAVALTSQSTIMCCWSSLCFRR